MMTRGSISVFVAAALALLGCDGERVAHDAGLANDDAGSRHDDGGVVNPDSGPIVEDGGGGGEPEHFVPNIPLTYDGTITEPGLEILAFTLYEASLGPRFLVSLQNTSTDLHLCALDLTTNFDDADGNMIAVARGGVETPLHRGVGGTGDLANCLSPGQIGMQAVRVDFGSGSSIEDVAAARWEVSAINLTDAVPSTDLDVTGVMTIDGDFGGHEFVGQLNNRSSDTVQNPSVSIFGVNEVGRPTVEGSDIDILTIPAGGSWSFETLSFDDEHFVDTVAFFEAHDL